ncbi:MAG: radical SAM protein [Desulfobacterales bacterium]|nr:radical SAM protein [Desulfobacterales bacterium]
MQGARKKSSSYEGFEQGPIRPPSEAYSLLIRITRNCPWNHCTFCPVYKKEEFSIRPVAHVIQDIEAISGHVESLRRMSNVHGEISRQDIQNYANGLNPEDRPAFHAALNWFACGMRSIFLQDANSLIIKPQDLIEILNHLKARFPWIHRITSYARSHTVARISDSDMTAIGKAGLNRIHIGLESGSDEVLKRVKKGVNKAAQINAGKKVKKAGIELSEYVMPGLGGEDLSEIHARETADALNQINPDFIRLRTLAIPNNLPLFDDFAAGKFKKISDYQAAKEILLFLECLDGIESTVKSDHILNLFQDLEGKLPVEKPKMMGVIRDFLNLDPRQRMLYQVGRRAGLLNRQSDLDNPQLALKVREICSGYGITPENVDDMINEMMKRFI